MTITNILLTLVVLVIAGAGIYYFIKKKKEAPQEYNINGYKIPIKPEIGTGVFNGEIGTILEIDEKEKAIKIQFDDEKIAWYGYNELEQIDHSYAMTIHKAQRK